MVAHPQLQGVCGTSCRHSLVTAHPWAERKRIVAAAANMKMPEIHYGWGNVDLTYDEKAYVEADATMESLLADCGVRGGA